MTTLIQANNIQAQRELAKYKTKKEFADALHALRFTIGLKTPKHVKRLLNWCADMNGSATASYGIGAFFHAEETIAKEMNCSISTIERAISWLKKQGLLFVVPTWDYANDKRGTSYKVFAAAKDIKAAVTNLVTQDKKVVRKLTGTLKGTQPEENSVIPTAEQAEKGDHKRPSIQNLNKTLKDNRLGDKPPADKIEKFFNKIKPDPRIMELVARRGWHTDQQLPIAQRIQHIINTTENANLDHEETIATIIGTLNNFTRDCHKGDKLRDQRKYLSALYTYVKSALKGYYSKQEVTITGTIKTIVEHRHIYGQTEPSFFDLCREIIAEEQEAKPDRKIINADEVTQRRNPPTRTELLPDWFNDNDLKLPQYKEPEIIDSAKKKASIEEKLAAFRESHPRAVNNLWT